jgi:hypothetical protein
VRPPPEERARREGRIWGIRGSDAGNLKGNTNAILQREWLWDEEQKLFVD